MELGLSPESPYGHQTSSTIKKNFRSPTKFSSNAYKRSWRKMLAFFIDFLAAPMYPELSCPVAKKKYYFETALAFGTREKSWLGLIHQALSGRLELLLLRASSLEG